MVDPRHRLMIAEFYIYEIILWHMMTGGGGGGGGGSHDPGWK